MHWDLQSEPSRPAINKPAWRECGVTQTHRSMAQVVFRENVRETINLLYKKGRFPARLIL